MPIFWMGLICVWDVQVRSPKLALITQPVCKDNAAEKRLADDLDEGQMVGIEVPLIIFLADILLPVRILLMCWSMLDAVSACIR